jgi:hypothetical protein
MSFQAYGLREKPSFVTEVLHDEVLQERRAMAWGRFLSGRRNDLERCGLSGFVSASRMQWSSSPRTRA